MATVLELRNRLTSLDIPSQVVSLNEKYRYEFLSANRRQMWDGQNPDGTDITPSYLDDPYFKTRKQAEAYANWKMKITPNAHRNKYAPNLFINGYFYSTLTLNTTELRITVTDPFGAQVAASHPKALGVSMENLKSISDGGYKADFFRYVESVTGLKIQ